jgi:hypothetical protein
MVTWSNTHRLSPLQLEQNVILLSLNTALLGGQGPQTTSFGLESGFKVSDRPLGSVQFLENGKKSRLN